MKNARVGAASAAIPVPGPNQSRLKPLLRDAEEWSGSGAVRSDLLQSAVPTNTTD
jgi:hypothetical protein